LKLTFSQDYFPLFTSAIAMSIAKIIRIQIYPVLRKWKGVQPTAWLRSLSSQPPAVTAHRSPSSALEKGRPAVQNGYTDRTDMCGALRTLDISRRVKLYGWVQHQRLGGQFIVLRDASGIVQVGTK